MKITRLKDGRWEFDSGEIQGVRIRRLFDTRADAETLLRKTRNDIRDHGQKLVVEWFSIPFNETAEILRYRRSMIALNGKPDWKKGEELHTTHLIAAKTGGQLANLLKEYIARKRKAGRNTDYINRIERELGAFVGRYPKLTAVEVTDRHIDAFLDGLGLELVTRANRIRDIAGLFSYAKKRGLCVVNPADLTEPIKIVKKRVKAFTPQQIAVLLWIADHNPDWDMVPYLAFGLYGSTRVCEAFRLDWEAYIEEESALVLEAAATKKNQERVTEDLPPVLIDWIRPYVKTKGAIAPSESTVEWRRAHYLVPAVKKILPGFSWIHNGLRKTSISAIYAISKDVKGTAITHGTSPEMVFANYRAVMRKTEAAKYLELTRANIVPYLRGLIPDAELDAWLQKYSCDKLAINGPEASEAA